MTDEALMQMAIDAAFRGTRAVRPNPLVGCAILGTNGRTASGFHACFGGPHAEIEALKAAKDAGLDPRGATFAVTLEPCSHHGKTPPCADALLAAGAGRVLVGGVDPNPLVAGRGIARLRAAGVEVREGVMQEACDRINREWLMAQRMGRPFVTLKMATSLDGLWTAEDGSSQWITSPEARLRGHDLRARVDAILTGRGTVERDDPSFTARDADGKLSPDQPRVFVLSRGEGSLAGRQLARHPGGAEFRRVDDLRLFLGELHAEGVHDLMVEAGPSLSSAFLEKKLVDEIWLFQGARLLGGAGRRLEALESGRLPGLELAILDVERFPAGDLLVKCAPSAAKPG